MGNWEDNPEYQEAIKKAAHKLADAVDEQVKHYFLGKGTLCFGKQIRFPRTKRKRIKEKWSKNFTRNWSIGATPNVINFQIVRTRIEKIAEGSIK